MCTCSICVHVVYVYISSVISVIELDLTARLMSLLVCVHWYMRTMWIHHSCFNDIIWNIIIIQVQASMAGVGWIGGPVSMLLVSAFGNIFLATQG